MVFPYGRRRARPNIYPAAAGTWRASTGFRKLRAPATIPVEAYTTRQAIPVGIDGQKSGTVGGAGTVTLQAGPAGVGQTWALDQAGFGTSLGAADTATASIYAGPQATSPYLVAQSYAAGGDAVGLAGIVLQPGEFVFVAWTGGTSGSTAQLKVSGTKTVLVA